MQLLSYANNPSASKRLEIHLQFGFAADHPDHCLFLALPRVTTAPPLSVIADADQDLTSQEQDANIIIHGGQARSNEQPRLLRTPVQGHQYNAIEIPGKHAVGDSFSENSQLQNRRGRQALLLFRPNMMPFIGLTILQSPSWIVILRKQRQKRSESSFP